MIEDLHEQKRVQRIRRLQITPEYLIGLFTPDIFLECIDGLPKDARLKGMMIDERNYSLNLYIESNEFEASDPAMEVPLMNISFKSYWGKELGVIRRLIASVKKAQDKTEEE